MLDAVAGAAQVGVCDLNAVPKVQLDVGLLRIPLSGPEIKDKGCLSDGLRAGFPFPDWELSGHHLRVEMYFRRNVSEIFLYFRRK